MDKREVVCNRVRKNILKMIYSAKSGHPGGSLSSVELLVCLFEHMKHMPSNPKAEERDRFVLSKGHASPVYYAVLSEYGYIPQDELMTFRKLGSRLQGVSFMENNPSWHGKAPNDDEIELALKELEV